jgi:hypothetical protein
MLIAALAVFFVGCAAPPQAIERLVGPAFSNSAQAGTNLNSSRSNRQKAGKKGGGGGAGLAVSDPGSEGSKPSKKNK